MACIYRHIRKDTNKPFYIGIGKKKYRPYDKNGRNKIWHNIVNSCGYEVEIIMDGLTIEEAREKEVEFIKLYGRIQDGGILCNLTNGADGKFGYKMPEDVKEKIAKANTGREVSKLTREKQRNNNLGKKHSEETKRKIGDAHKGMKRSKETCLKISESNKGKEVSQEAKDKMRIKKLGRKLSEETKLKMSLAHKGKKFSDETIERMKAAQANRPIEFRKKISEHKKRWWQEKKAKEIEQNNLIFYE